MIVSDTQLLVGTSVLGDNKYSFILICEYQSVDVSWYLLKKESNTFCGSDGRLKKAHTIPKAQNSLYSFLSLLESCT